MLKSNLEGINNRITDLIYYWYLDDRPRKQYLHVLRTLREDIYEFIESSKVLKKVYYTISPKIKQDEIEECINKLKELWENEPS